MIPVRPLKINLGLLIKMGFMNALESRGLAGLCTTGLEV